MFRYLLGLLFIYCFQAGVAQEIKLQKLKLPRGYTAIYDGLVDELYSVKQGIDSAAKTEWVASYATLNIRQEILEKKKNYIQADYLLNSFSRIDSLRKADGTIDTSTNQGKILMHKLILQFDGRGHYLGPTVELPSHLMQQRDFKYFYNRCKGLVFKLDRFSAMLADTLMPRTDTLFHPGFNLIVKHRIKWQLAGRKDTLGLHCLELRYRGENGTYSGTDNMMKALGFDALHSGIANVTGRMLLDEKTGRVVLFDEFGTFTGTVVMGTPNEIFTWPSEYSYHRKMALTSLTKTPRKKFLGLF